ncbi:MAG: tRNA (adenosine(37)-N6)-threonylcarbamoyltransferase complex dimerization subunit type 1 TsaB [Bacteroidales bacterium]|jgi:tRNA threonylcarbamoyladenosine biosynthesis protein TsaB|nr:tRNA (adenosine(37)-N6)-threonylcarbamoyltransferase complex dimerization subunit type 1 TsaB [Bacteroidales bacterium]
MKRSNIILNIETSTDLCSVALSEGEKTLYQFVSDSKNEHASTLSLYIENALKQSGKTFKDISAIAVGIGPGSYTGLRIGTSAAKGLAYALNIPIIGVSSLRAMASHVINLGIPPPLAELRGRGRAFRCKVASKRGQRTRLRGLCRARATSLRSNNLFCPPHSPRCKKGFPLQSLMRFVPMLDAGRMEVYTAIYDYSLNEITPAQALILAPNAFEELTEKHTLVFFGSGSNKFREMTQNATNGQASAGQTSADDGQVLADNATPPQTPSTDCEHILTSPQTLSECKHIFIDNITPLAAYMVPLAAKAYAANDFLDTAYFEPLYLKEFIAKSPTVKGLK